MSQVLESPLEAGRDAVRRRDWDAAYPLLQEADSSGDLAPEDLELLAEAALWGGLFGEYMDANERAYKGYVEAGNLLRAAYIATLLAHDYRAQLQASVASGWLSRAKRHLDETEEAPEHGYWALQQSLVALGEHDYDEAFRQGKAAEEIGRRFSDRSLEIRGIFSTRRARRPSGASSTRIRPSLSTATRSARAAKCPISTAPRSGRIAPPSSATRTPCPRSPACAASTTRR